MSPSKAVAPDAGLAIQGKVRGGQQPISAAHVYLLAANTTGYGNASVSLLTSTATTTLDTSGGATNGDYFVTTDSNGNFSITNSYSCTQNTQVYLYALGGNPGSGTNSAAGLLAVLGSCPAGGSFLATTPFILVNEVSTVAAAYAFAGFATDATHVSSPGAALSQTGIANAFANASNLAALSTGAALATTPAGNGTVPQATINSLANILASCVNSTGPASLGCSTLFTNAIGAGSTGTAPSDTASAAINIAHNPGSNVAALYGISTSNPPFAPTLSAQPNDFTIVLSFTGGGLSKPEALAIDGSGNAWIADAGNGTGTGLVAKLSPAGAAISLSSGYTGGGLYSPTAIAIDESGNAWIANAGSASQGVVAELSNTGVAISPSSGYSVSGLGASFAGPTGIAIDGFGNPWIANEQSITELSTSGTAVSPASGFTGDGISSAEGIAIDGSGNVWISNAFNVSELSGSGTLVSPAFAYAAGGPCCYYGIANDSSGNAWVVNGSAGVIELSSNGTAISPSYGYTGGGLSSPRAIAMDGSANAWVANFGSITELSNVGSPLSPSTGYGGALWQAANGPQPFMIAIDASGNVWTGSNSSAILEFIGVATPVITPIAAAVQNGTIGTPPGGLSPSLQSISVSGATSLAMGQTQQLTATALYSDGLMKDVTSSATWMSSASAFAAVSPVGSVTAIAPGQAMITATYSGLSGSQTEAVAAKTLVSLGVSAPSLTIYLGATQQFAAVGTYNDGSMLDLTSSVAWQTSDITKATVSSAGTALGVAAGTLTISASSGAVNASASVTVSSANSGFALVNDTTDSRLLTYHGPDGSISTFLGTRDSNGNPISTYGARIDHPDQSWQEFSFDSSGRTTQILTSDGTQVFLNWSSVSAATLTLLTSDQAAFYIQPISLSSSPAQTVGAIKQAATTSRSESLAHPMASPPPSSTQASVAVRSRCAGGVPEDGLTTVHITRGGFFGGTPVPASDVGNGTYSADLGSGDQLANPFPQAAIDAGNAIANACNDIQAGSNGLIAETGAINGALSVIEQLCYPPPPNVLAAIACGTLEVGLEGLNAGLYGINAACSLQSNVSNTTTAVNFVNSLLPQVQLTFDATFNGTPLQKTLPNQPSLGPFAQGPPIEFDCPKIASVTVTPASPSVAPGSTEALTAVALDASQKVVGSSGFQWNWNSDTQAVATVVNTTSTSTNGIIVPGGLTLMPVGQVTGVSPGTANIGATELTQGVTGYAPVTVSQPKPYSGTAANGVTTYGGGIYCNYQATTSNTTLSLSLNAAATQVQSGTMSLTFDESIVGSCPYPPGGISTQTYSLSSGTISGNSITASLTGVSSNQFVSLNGTLNGNSIAGTLEIQRGDLAGTPLYFTISVPFQLTQQ